MLTDNILDLIGNTPLVRLKGERVFTKAEYYRQDGQHKLAVALYRQILQRFRKSPQSSLAHQRLEDYGIKTGGGVINALD